MVLCLFRCIGVWRIVLQIISFAVFLCFIENNTRCLSGLLKTWATLDQLVSRFASTSVCVDILALL
jgi:hypothetical protein